MLKVWGRNTSLNVQKVMWAIGELELPHERFDVGGSFGKTKEAVYLAINPTALIPTLQDGDFSLWESNVIVRYLAREYGSGKLEPTDKHSRARADQWMDWQQTFVTPALSPAFIGLIRTPVEKRDPAVIAASQSKSTEAMKILDAHLGRNAFVAGESFSMGDIPIGVSCYRFRQLVTERPNLANLERWYAALQLRPAFRQYVEAIPLQ